MKKLVACAVLFAFVVSSCTTVANIRPQDYGRIEPDETYQVITVDGTTYQAKNLAVTDSVATFTTDKVQKSVPVSSIKQIQQVNNQAILKAGLGVGAAIVLTVGLVLLLQPD